MTDLEVLYQQAVSRANERETARDKIYDQGYQDGFSDGVDRLYSEIKFCLNKEGAIDKMTLKKIRKDLKRK